MHDVEIVLRLAKDGIVDTVRAGHLLVFRGVREPFLLDPGDVEDVRVGYRLLQGGGLPRFAALCPEGAHDVLGHLEAFGGHQGQSDPEHGQGLGEGVHRPSVFQVADQGDVESVQGSFGLLHGEEIEEHLGGVGAGPVAGIDDRFSGNVRRESGGAFIRVPQDYAVAVGVHHPDGVGKGLALGDGGHGHLGDVHYVASEPVRRTLEGELGTGGRFEEKIRHNLSVQGALGLFATGVRHHFLREVKDIFDLLSVEVADGDQVLVFEIHGSAIVYSALNVCLAGRSDVLENN